MSPEAIIALVGGLLGVAGFAFFVARRVPKRIKTVQYVAKWRALQKLCSIKENWPQALMGADDLLDEVLKKKQKNGKTMGERMVSAQDYFTNNDALWQAHKLAGHLRHHTEETYNLKESEVKECLTSFRQALRDLGAL